MRSRTALTPALRDELAVSLDRSPFKQPTDRVLPTSTGGGDSGQNVRKRLLLKSVEKANVELERLGIEPIGSVPLHGLRRTYATLRVLAGDDVVSVSSQIGHENPTFTPRIVRAGGEAPGEAEGRRAQRVRRGNRGPVWGVTLDAPVLAPIGTNGDPAVPVAFAKAGV